MARKSIADIEKVWLDVERMRKISDRVIGIGPFGVGLDAALTWVPVVGTVYSVGAAGWLLVQAMKVKAPPATVARMLAYLGLDSATTAIGEVPLLDFVPNVVDTLFPGHLMAARALQKHIESTHWVEDSQAAARASGEHERHLAKLKSDRKLKRIVYLHD